MNYSNFLVLPFSNKESHWSLLIVEQKRSINQGMIRQNQTFSEIRKWQKNQKQNF